MEKENSTQEMKRKMMGNITMKEKGRGKKLGGDKEDNRARKGKKNSLTRACLHFLTGVKHLPP